ncbi:hypothetical protein NM688_g5898 [Phlebia brevispora]|uniref:Uncharacterized protein n=1 Tax=Phlebia brevispora TaxID=194682 RepID=A0ACC1SN75_9APHY|nr:hypothetical protein NM688_g5898 [Phlebia brevispora]
MPQSTPSESTDGLDAMYKTYALTFQTLLFGFYIVLVPFSAHVLLKRGFQRGTNVILLTCTFAPFVISAAYWVVSLAEQIERMRTYFVDRSLRDVHSILTYDTLFNALIYINYVFGDGVVVWRAYTLCRYDYRKLLVIPALFLVLTTVFVFGSIGLRVASFFTPAGPTPTTVDPIKNAIDIFQVGAAGLSLITNCSATAIISHKAWRHRQVVRENLGNARNRHTQAERILALLIETGVLYLVSSVLLLVFMPIRLSFGTIGDIYTPCHLQIAGIYPTLVIVLVGLQQTLKETTFWSAGEATAHSDVVPSNEVSHIRFSSPRSRAFEQSNGSSDEHVRSVADAKSSEEV